MPAYAWRGRNARALLLQQQHATVEHFYVSLRARVTLQIEHALIVGCQSKPLQQCCADQQTQQPDGDGHARIGHDRACADLAAVAVAGA